MPLLDYTKCVPYIYSSDFFHPECLNILSPGYNVEIIQKWGSWVYESDNLLNTIIRVSKDDRSYLISLRWMMIPREATQDLSIEISSTILPYQDNCDDEIAFLETKMSEIFEVK